MNPNSLCKKKFNCVTKNKTKGNLNSYLLTSVYICLFDCLLQSFYSDKRIFSSALQSDSDNNTVVINMARIVAECYNTSH